MEWLQKLVQIRQSYDRTSMFLTMNISVEFLLSFFANILQPGYLWEKFGGDQNNFLMYFRTKMYLKHIDITNIKLNDYLYAWYHFENSIFIFVEGILASTLPQNGGDFLLIHLLQFINVTGWKSTTDANLTGNLNALNNV